MSELLLPATRPTRQGQTEPHQENGQMIMRDNLVITVIRTIKKNKTLIITTNGC
jgi:hypothetical protein